MLICKDCIHYDLCMDKFKKQYSIYADKDITVDECEQFKNKADFVEVVMCKDCRNRIEKNWAKCAGRKPDDFCSDGIRRFK